MQWDKKTTISEPRVAGQDRPVALLQPRLLHHLHLLLPVDDSGRHLKVGGRLPRRNVLPRQGGNAVKKNSA